MNFLQYLNENRQRVNNQHSTKIDLEEAKKILIEKCSNMDFNKPIWRGSKSGEAESYILEGQKGSRRSANTSNHYTLILDEQLKKYKNYPLRSKSIIMASHDNKDYAQEFGGLYAVFPYNDTIIGVCPRDDIWYTDVNHLGETFEIMNGVFNELEIPDGSFDGIVEYLSNNKESVIKLARSSDEKKFVEYIYDGKSSIKDKVIDLYDLDKCGFSFITTDKISSIYNKKLELWIGGPCVAISYNTWNELVHDKFKI